jgi:hypothetical protein
LKFNQSFEKYRDGGVVMRYHETLVARFASKLVLDILPATTASLIGGLLFTHYGLGRVPEPAIQVEPASAEMMQLLRDEHGLIVSFMSAQLEREKSELAAESTPRRPNADAAAATTTPAHASAAAVSVKAVSARTKVATAAPSSAVTAAASAPLAPLVIAQVEQPESTGAASQGAQLLIAKTAGLKDHVVSVTHRVVSTLGGIPGWIGDRLGGTNAKPRPAADVVTTS